MYLSIDIAVTQSLTANLYKPSERKPKDRFDKYFDKNLYRFSLLIKSVNWEIKRLSPFNIALKAYLGDDIKSEAK